MTISAVDVTVRAFGLVEEGGAAGSTEVELEAEGVELMLEEGGPLSGCASTAGPTAEDAEATEEADAVVFASKISAEDLTPSRSRDELLTRVKDSGIPVPGSV